MPPLLETANSFAHYLCRPFMLLIGAMHACFAEHIFVIMMLIGQKKRRGGESCMRLSTWSET